MQYGYFDDANREYVITRPDTPRSWSNYLGTTEYGAIITNNAGGYSFFKSAAQGRFMRLRFNAIPLDQPGRYVYLHDRDSKDYWSASWQPVGKPLAKYKSVCRHGTAYTVITSEYSVIKTESTYFVPLGRAFECWLVKITNNDSKKRNLRMFTYVEYGCNWKAADDLNNLQYTQYIAKMDVVDGIIDHGSNVNMPYLPDDFEEKDQGRHTFMAITGAPVTGWDTDREKFLGLYRGYGNPLAVEKGECSNSLAVGDNPCGTLQVDIDLEPGESREVLVLMGIGMAALEGKKIAAEFKNPAKAYEELAALKQYWHSRLQNMFVQTPDSEFNSMMNMWSPFNCLMTYTWSRAASLVYAGERDGLGYRDSVQDMLGVIHTIPDTVRERLELLITGQVSTGGAMPVVKQFSHHPGKEEPIPETEYRSDDVLWLFNSIPAYVKETGDISFYNKELPYADKGQDTVFYHLKRAIQFSLDRSGAHGFPCGLRADWNDCLVLGQDGESVMVAFQLRYALDVFMEISRLLNKPAEGEWAAKHLAILDKNIEKHGWDGEWYMRAYRHDGFKFGSRESEEGSIFLNTQTWAVYSGHTDRQKAEMVMKAVNERLATEYGLALCNPPFVKTDFKVIKATLFNKSMKENGSIFCHTQGWAVIAETMLGHGDRAYQYFRSYMPAVYNTKAEIREIEPYVYCQSTHAKYSPRYGASRLPWLSGSATWSYYAATQYILGVRPEVDGLRIDPCVPAEWQEFSVQRVFRGKLLHIKFDNKAAVQKGVIKILLNNKEIQGNFLPLDLMQKENQVVVTMGKN